MTSDDFRRLALSLPDAVENAHMDHPDFRVGGRVFATLGYPDSHWGMVKLTPEQQHEFVQLSPETFQPLAGGWGRHGSTNVRLESANAALLEEALLLACRQAKQKASTKRPRRTSRH